MAPRYEFPGHDPIETSLPAEGVQLRAEGWREMKARTAVVREADAERVETVEAQPEPVDEPATETPEQPKTEGSKQSRKK